MAIPKARSKGILESYQKILKKNDKNGYWWLHKGSEGYNRPPRLCQGSEGYPRDRMLTAGMQDFLGLPKKYEGYPRDTTVSSGVWGLPQGSNGCRRDQRATPCNSGNQEFWVLPKGTESYPQGSEGYHRNQRVTPVNRGLTQWFRATKGEPLPCPKLAQGWICSYEYKSTINSYNQISLVRLGSVSAYSHPYK